METERGATQAEAMRPPEMTCGQAMEFWFWCEAAAEEKRREPSPGSSSLESWERSACLRIQAAFERYHRNGSSCRRGIHDPLEARLERGLDAVGLVLFNRYLSNQCRLWGGRAARGISAVREVELERVEAVVRLGVVNAARGLLFRLVGVDGDEIERRAATLPIATDDRLLQTGLTLAGVRIYDEREEGPIPPEEERPRWKAAKEAMEAKIDAKRKGLLS